MALQSPLVNQEEVWWPKRRPNHSRRHGRGPRNGNQLPAVFSPFLLPSSLLRADPPERVSHAEILSLVPLDDSSNFCMKTWRASSMRRSAAAPQVSHGSVSAARLALQHGPAAWPCKRKEDALPATAVHRLPCQPLHALNSGWRARKCGSGLGADTAASYSGESVWQLVRLRAEAASKPLLKGSCCCSWAPTCAHYRHTHDTLSATAAPCRAPMHHCTCHRRISASSGTPCSSLTWNPTQRAVAGSALLTGRASSKASNTLEQALHFRNTKQQQQRQLGCGPHSTWWVKPLCTTLLASLRWRLQRQSGAGFHCKDRAACACALAVVFAKQRACTIPICASGLKIEYSISWWH